MASSFLSLPGQSISTSSSSSCASCPCSLTARPALLPCRSRHPRLQNAAAAAAARRSSPSPSSSGRSLTKGRSKGKEGAVVDEELYNIDDGWNIELDVTQKMMEVAGVQLPVRLKLQLEQERRQRAVTQHREEEAPRLTHKLLRVMAGKVGGRKLISFADMNVRPMMEVVRGAVFNILQALGGCSASLPAGRWLDLYSGTGSVGIEALSRGCESAHFVEMDPCVVAQVLDPNLSVTGFHSQAVVHTTRVEALLQQAIEHGAEILGGKFDYISVTPPYEAVEFAALMQQLSTSPLVKEETCIVVEYPKKSSREMPETCGLLVKIRDRRYGRTHVAIYGPAWAKDTSNQGSAVNAVDTVRIRVDIRRHIFGGDRKSQLKIMVDGASNNLHLQDVGSLEADSSDYLYGSL